MLNIFWILTFVVLTSAQEQRYYFGAPQQGQFVQGLSSPDANYFIQSPGSFQQQDFLEGDLQTSDLPPHLQQTLPQYQFSRFNQPAVQHPAPFQLPSRAQNTANTYLFHDTVLPKGPDQQIPKPQPLSLTPKRIQAKPPHSHFLTHSHDPSQTETFLGQITLQNPDPPVDFNPAGFRPSKDFPFQHSPSLVDQFSPVEDRWRKAQNVPVKPSKPVRQRINNKPFRQFSESVDQDLEQYTDRDNQNRNDFQQRRFKPAGGVVDRPFTNSVQTDNQYSRPLKPKPRPNFVINSNGDVFATTRSAFRPKPTSSTLPPTTASRRNRFHPTTKAPSKPLAFHLKPNKIPFAPKKTTTSTTTEHSLDLESLLEERINENTQHSIYEDDVEVVQSNSDTTTIQTTTSLEDQTTEAPQDEEDSSTGVTETDAATTTNQSSEQEKDKTITETENKPTTDEEPPVSTTKFEEDITTAHENQTHIPEEVPHTVSALFEEEQTTTSHPTIPGEHGDYTDNIHYDYYDEDYEDFENKTTTSLPETTVVENEEISSSEGREETNDPSLKTSEETTVSPLTTMSDSEFEILTLKPSPMTVEDDNFNGFVDSILIDNSTEEPNSKHGVGNSTGNVTASTTMPSVSSSENVSSSAVEEQPKLIGEAVVSVVTTKSVVNGTISLPVTPIPDVTVQMNSPERGKETSSENWMVVASVQTSRSVSGARYLAFPSSEQELPMQSLVPEDQVPKDSSVVQSSSDLLSDTSSSAQSSSTESISDKLDRVQSELSSGFLSGGFRNAINNIAIITEPAKAGDVTSSSTTTTSTTTTTTTQKPTTTPVPVIIRKFSPNLRPSTTHRPRKTYIPNISASHRPLPILPKTSTQSQPQQDAPQSDEPENKNATTPKRLNTNIFKNRITIKEDISAFLPPGYKLPKPENKTQPNDQVKTPNTTKLLSKLFENIEEIDTKLLPSNFKVSTTTTTSTTAKTINIEALLSKSVQVDNTAFLPPGFKPVKEPTSTEQPSTSPPPPKKNTTSETKVPKIEFNIPASLLPPGFKLPSSNESETTPKSKLVTEVFALPENLLPPGYKQRFTPRKSTASPNKPTEATSTTEPPSSTTPASTVSTTTGRVGLVFPSRPGGRKPINRITTPRSSNPENAPPTPVIQKGWPTRATTEFTGWPTPSTTPISIEKLLEAARLATSSSLSTETYSPSVSTTTSTTTTTTTPAPTTPGVCSTDCDLAATIKLVGGAYWVPELLHHNTKEWQILANEVQTQLEKVYNSSATLSKWYRKIQIEEFSKGSVLVDYFVELSELGRKVDTTELKTLFNEALAPAPTAEARSITDTDKPKDKSASRLMLGSFVIDSEYTDFIVIPKQVLPTVDYAEDNVLLPQWAIAVIVIGLASLLFVIIFGVTVLVNRQKNSKKKQPIPLSDEMLNELNKNHMGGLDNYGADDLYNMEDVWNDKGYETKLPKQKSTSSLHENSMSNLYDSWKSEWNGYYYNAYYGNHTASSNSGYTRRRSDYDTNF